jgi:hypothetical protein
MSKDNAVGVSLPQFLTFRKNQKTKKSVIIQGQVVREAGDVEVVSEGLAVGWVDELEDGAGLVAKDGVLFGSEATKRAAGLVDGAGHRFHVRRGPVGLW